jgi:CRISPR-associated protein Cas5d
MRLVQAAPRCWRVREGLTLSDQSPDVERAARLGSSRYAVCVEVAGPLAMFARPDTGGTPTSYPVPTWSACKGIFEAVAMLGSGDAWVCPTRVEVCRPRGAAGGSVRFQRYATNYGGPLRKADQIRKGASLQLFATVLAGVCYRLHGEVRGERLQRGANARHHLQEMFMRRLAQGQCHHTPALGWREFTCSYCGEFRHDAYEVDRDLNLVIPSMLVSMWDNPHGGQYSPRFAQDIRIEAGVLVFAE